MLNFLKRFSDEFNVVGCQEPLPQRNLEKGSPDSFLGRWITRVEPRSLNGSLGEFFGDETHLGKNFLNQDIKIVSVDKRLGRIKFVSDQGIYSDGKVRTLFRCYHDNNWKISDRHNDVENQKEGSQTALKEGSPDQFLGEWIVRTKPRPIIHDVDCSYIDDDIKIVSVNKKTNEVQYKSSQDGPFRDCIFTLDKMLS